MPSRSLVLLFGSVALAGAASSRNGHLQWLQMLGLVATIPMAGAVAVPILSKRNRWWPLTLMPVAVTSSVIMNLDRPYSIDAIAASLVFFALLTQGWILAQILPSSVFARLVYFCLLALILVSLMLRFSYPELVSIERVIDEAHFVGLFGSKNHLGYMIALMVASSAVLRSRVVATAIGVAGLGVAVASSADAGAAIVLLLLAPILGGNAVLKRFRRVATAVPLISLLSFLPLWFVGLRFEPLDRALGGRLQIWSGALALIRSALYSGFSFGFWRGDGERIRVIEHSARLRLNPDAIAYAHNTGLDIFLQTGALGLAAYILIWTTAVRSVRADAPLLLLAMVVLVNGIVESRAPIDVSILLLGYFLGKGYSVSRDVGANSISRRLPRSDDGRKVVATSKSSPCL